MTFTTGQRVALGLGVLAGTGFTTVVAYQNRLITLPKSIANFFGVPPIAPSPADEEAGGATLPFKNKSECEAAGFDWHALKEECIFVSFPPPGTTFSKSVFADNVMWILEKPYFVTLLTYRFKAGGIWNVNKTNDPVNVSYLDLDGKWHGLGSSDKVAFGTTSKDQSATVGDKAVAFRWTVQNTWWDDIDTIFALII